MGHGKYDPQGRWFRCHATQSNGQQRCKCARRDGYELRKHVKAVHQGLPLAWDDIGPVVYLKTPDDKPRFTLVSKEKGEEWKAKYHKKECWEKVKPTLTQLEALPRQVPAINPPANTQQQPALSEDAQAEFDTITASLNENGGVARGFWGPCGRNFDTTDDAINHSKDH